MPGWYVHIQAAGLTMERLLAAVPPGSPLTQAQANDLFTAAHDNRNYLAAGALGPDLFFLLPDFKGDQGKGLLAMAEFVLKFWKEVDDNFIEQWNDWMSPVLDNNSQLANQISGGMLGEIGQVLGLLSGSLQNFIVLTAVQMNDVLGLFSSGTQKGYDDNTFFWSDMFHYRKTYQFARQLYANALKADVDIKNGGTSEKAKHRDEPSRVPKQQAFALGWMTHCATDVAAHPFTNAKCGGPFRTHWQRHKVIENHIDAFVYGQDHPSPPPNYDELDKAALHFRLAFRKGTPPGSPPDPRMPDDVPGPDWFPQMFNYPAYSEADNSSGRQDRRQKFDMDSEPLPEHICELLIKTMQDVYTGAADTGGPQILRWVTGKHIGDGGRPTVKVLQDMYGLVYQYAKFTSSSGTELRQPVPPPVIGDHSLPQFPGPPIDGNADPLAARQVTILDILLAILAFAIWVAQMSIWITTILPALLADLLTWPLRTLIYQLLVVPVWDLYMLIRKSLVLTGYISPRRSEISTGLIRLGADEKGTLLQLRADLDEPSGFALPLVALEPSGLDVTRGASTQGYGLDPAYPRALVTDLQPAFSADAPLDASMVPSEFVAPWRYPEHNMAGMRNGWEAPRAHVGPYEQGQEPDVLMDTKFVGSDAARRRFEDARTPEESEAVSAELLPLGGQHLGNPIAYGMYLIGQLTGRWQSPTGYLSNDWQHPLPDFNLDSDRGYAYQCWDYLRHAESKPPSPVTELDRTRPDQWRCTPQQVSLLDKVPGAKAADILQRVYEWYSYQEPCTVPQQYQAGDNPHHVSRYDPLRRLVIRYRMRPGETEPPPGCPDIDYDVSDAEMLAARMSPTGRRV